MVELPMSVRLMWGLAETGKRGPKRALTMDEVLEAAIEIADAEGLAALSMSRLAKKLGFTTMALYRYIDTKDTLLVLLMDHLVGRPPTIPLNQGWRIALDTWAREEFHRIRRHTWWLDIALSGGPPTGPNNMEWLELGLAAFADTRVPEPVKFQLVINLSFYVMGRARLAAQLSGGDDDDYAAILTQVLDPTRFPAIMSAMSQQAFDDSTANWEEADFGFALDRLLDGYEKLVNEY